MHTRASNSELVEPLPEPERTLNQRLHRRNRRLPFEQRNEPPAQPRVVYAPILDISYFHHFLDILENYNPMDGAPMWAADRVVALTPGSIITILETTIEFAIKESHSKQPNLESNDDDTPMSRKEEAKFMQTFYRTRFYNDYNDSDSNCDNWLSSRRNDYNQDNYQSHSYDKPDVQKQLSDFIKAQHSNKSFIKDTFMDLKTKLETTTKNHQSSIQNLKVKFDKLDDKESGRPSGSLPSNTQPKLKADHGVSINLMPYSLYAKFSLKTLKPTKMSVRLADRSFQYPVGIAENMLVAVGKFTFSVDFVILKMEEDNKVPLTLGRPFLHTTDVVNRVKQKQLNLGVGTERKTFHMDSAMKHSYSNDDTCFSIDVLDEILKEDFDALLDE
nr:reverse transcriptase domain-containing protein [Tanacetum cinerariifolium]